MTSTDPDTVDYAERRRRGLHLYKEVMGVEHPEPTSPRSAGLIDFVFAEVWSRGVLTRRERRLISLSSLAGADAFGSVGEHLYGALVSGDLSRPELDEWILHFAVYCGWGKAETCETVLDEQVKRIAAESGSAVPERGTEPLTSVPADQELRKQGGEAEFREVNYAAAPSRGIPYFDDGILNFVFGDMWKRPGLSRKDRRLITVACVGLDDTAVPIRSHVYSALKSGDVSLDEMQELVLQFAAYSGWPKASMLQSTVMTEWARVRNEAEAGLVR
ncbi:MAG TPA: carboxymuconolactone decarboxylase family protein [Amycolatopsis sp.]|nr:carboxymuconolactone decarboxylase family protein [Amycolatopsis sp.]